MPRFQFRLDLAVGTAYLTADRDQESAIDVCALVLVSEEHGTLWKSTKAYPLNAWALDNAKEDAQRLEQVARQHWPALAGATDWFIPDSEQYAQMNDGGWFDGSQQL